MLMSSSEIPESDIIDAAFSLSSDDDSESELSGSPLSDSPCRLKNTCYPTDKKDL